MTFDLDINDLSDISYLITRDSIVVDVGTAFFEMTGYSRNEILENNISDVILQLLRLNTTVYNLENYPEDKSLYLFTKSCEAREVIVHVITRVFPFEKVYMFFEKVNSRLEEKLPMTEKLLLENRLGIGIYSSPEMILLRANQFYLKFLDVRYKKENTIGFRICDLINGWEGSLAEEGINEVIYSGNSIHIEEIKKYIDPENTGFFDNTIIPAVFNGNIKYVISMVQDVTERVLLRKQSENQKKATTQLKEQLNNKIALLNAEKEALEKAIEMKDEFFSFVTHEFKTPITVVNSAIQAIELLCKDEMSAKLKGFIGNIKQNTLRQLRLVNNFLDITRINAGRVRINKKNIDIVFLTKAITESVQLYAQQKEIKLVFSSSLKHKIIGIDDEKYERILLNLLSNAIKFTPKGETITVKLDSENKKIYIEVTDTGPGIPQDKLDLIFERFGQVDSSLTRQAEGAGIGLSLVKLFVEALDGSISVKSSVGKGSTFMIMLPADKVVENKDEKTLKDITDNRLIHATTIEFSDVYLQ